MWARQPSLVVLRNLHSGLGEQRLVPPRCLFGTLPDALLAQYECWPRVCWPTHRSA